ncbi:MAG: hypothetical protein ACRD8Z_26420 [Nitrososphaeraceae archaeon]
MSAILNSSVSNKSVKPFQPRGHYGKRDIGIRPFMMPIPKFDSTNETHINLAKLSEVLSSLTARPTNNIAYLSVPPQEQTVTHTRKAKFYLTL